MSKLLASFATPDGSSFRTVHLEVFWFRVANLPRQIRPSPSDGALRIGSRFPIFGRSIEAFGKLRYLGPRSESAAPDSTISERFGASRIGGWFSISSFLQIRGFRDSVVQSFFNHGGHRIHGMKTALLRAEQEPFPPNPPFLPPAKMKVALGGGWFVH